MFNTTLDTLQKKMQKEGFGSIQLVFLLSGLDIWRREATSWNGVLLLGKFIKYSKHLKSLLVL